MSIKATASVSGLLLRQVFWAALVVAAVVGLGVYPSWQLAGSRGLEAMFWAGLICPLAAVVSLIPVAFAMSHRSDWLGQACLCSTVIRMLTTLVLGGVCYVVVRPMMAAYAVWMVAVYLALLVWETAWMYRLARDEYGVSSAIKGRRGSELGRRGRELDGNV